jgi:predicted nucleotidyltransferase
VTAVVFEELARALATACHEVYGPRLVSLAIFGSVARGTARPDSDLDFLIVAEGLPVAKGTGAGLWKRGLLLSSMASTAERGPIRRSETQIQW